MCVYLKISLSRRLIKIPTTLPLDN
uniref:Uncharacterized protein n=1 Tax=Rhizophora mucronata TaxID=61149 RepID=A0A2P2NRM6_RHIMU